MPGHRWTTIRGHRVFSRATAGASSLAPLVMVHGAIVSSDYYLPLAGDLAGTLECHLVDMPGYGRSEGFERQLRIEELADWLGEWMSHTGLARAHLLGNSLGAQVTVALAQRTPSLVERMVLVGPTVDPASRSRLGQLTRLAADAALEPPGLHLIWLRDFLRAGVRRSWATLDVALDDAIEARLPEVRAPTLVLRGTRDPLVSRRWGEEAARLLPSGRYEEIDDAAHGAHYRRPQAVASRLREFLGA